MKVRIVKSVLWEVEYFNEKNKSWEWIPGKLCFYWLFFAKRFARKLSKASTIENFRTVLIYNDQSSANEEVKNKIIED